MTSQEFSNPLRKFKLVFLGEQSGKSSLHHPLLIVVNLKLTM